MNNNNFEKQDGYKRKKLNKSQEAMRECLRCPADPVTGKIPKFLSLSPGNRVCPKCSNILPGINTLNLSRAGKGVPLENADFMSTTTIY